MPFAIAGAADVDRAAARLDAVHGLEIARGVEIPQHLAVGGRKGAEVAVDRSAEHRAGIAAAGADNAGLHDGLSPHAFGRDNQTCWPSAIRNREQPAADFAGSVRRGRAATLP